MKTTPSPAKWILLGLLAAGLSACGDEGPKRDRSPAKMADENDSRGYDVADSSSDSSPAADAE